MSEVLAVLTLLPSLVLLSLGAVPSRIANRNLKWTRWSITSAAVFAVAVAVSAAAALAMRGPWDVQLVSLHAQIPVSLSVYFDSLTAIMLLLISLIGAVVIRFSMRYLDGESSQGQFLRWLSFTLGSILFLVVSGNLAMYTVAWMSTSFGLHRLLTHYPGRSKARWVAREKFLISRFGDVLLLAGLAFAWLCYGSLDYSNIFAAAREGALGPYAADWMPPVMAAFFVLGAMTKSAQFPFHCWLPDTMDTPTPVSALMHAGIINAGGFLVIRLSPIVMQSQLALDFLASAGAATALFAAIVMLTQSSVKRSLAYSTIAQMGFMMLQCGLGAFSAALLHLVAHSLYKAHAFLSSGNALTRVPHYSAKSQRLSATGLRVAAVIALGLAIAMPFLARGVLQLDSTTKPGGTVLGAVLTIALMQLLWNGLQYRSSSLWMRTVAAGGVVSFAYYVAYLVIDSLLPAAVSQGVADTGFSSFLTIGVVVGFSAVFLLQVAIQLGWQRPWLERLWVHASNGFYIDIVARRITAQVWRAPSPAE